MLNSFPRSRLCFSRRSFLAGGTALAGAAVLPRVALTAPALTLKPGALRVPLVGPGHPETDVWAYNGVLPGPTLKARQGERLRVHVVNGLGEETTVHWHGIRLANPMDGVPGLTQAPIPPGGVFDYDFALKDAGTFWYHPHSNSAEQLDRGLSGPLIVAEADPPRVDRDVVWVLDDWRLDKQAAVIDDFGRGMDLSHAGRIGNTVTINGRVPDAFALRAGERIRLRLINVANARHMRLTFAGHKPRVIALDGHPVAPHAPESGAVTLAPAQRADLILDAEGKPGETHDVIDDFYSRRRYRLLRLRYSDDKPLRSSPLDAPVALAPNPLPEPDLKGAKRHAVVMAGGAMGGMRSAILGGEELGIRTLARRGKVWALNGIAARDVLGPTLFRCDRGSTHVMAIRNDTAFPHPMHLHGFAFRLLSRNGAPAPHRPWLDTVLVFPEETVEVAFVADNPGRWLFHCHVVEHMLAGMSAVIEVA